MSNLVIQSNVQSPLLSGLVQTSQEDISYAISPSMPLMAATTQVLPSRNTIPAGDPAGKEVVLDVPRMSFLREVQLKTTFTPGANLDEDNPLGLKIFREVQLRSANKILITQSDSYCMARTMDSTVEKANSIFIRAMPHQTTNGELSVGGTLESFVYTPVFTCFTENDPRNFFNLRQYEALQIAGIYNVNAAYDESAAITGVKTELVISTVDYDDQTTKLLLAENSPIGSPTQFLGYSSFKEQIPAVAGTTQKILINSQAPASATYIYVKDVANQTATIGLNNPFALHRIKEYTIRVNGVALHEKISYLEGNYISDQYFGASGVKSDGKVVSCIQDGVLAIHWNMDKNRTYCSGALACVALNRIEIEIELWESATDTTDEVVYCNEYLQMLSFDNEVSSISVLSAN